MPQHNNANWRSIESSIDIKDYFDNKISMRRSIDKKLHYDHIKSSTMASQPGAHQMYAAKPRQSNIIEKKIVAQSQKMR